jgi:membrane protein implicated in regulation of membrane protease activity
MGIHSRDGGTPPDCRVVSRAVGALQGAVRMMWIPGVFFTVLGVLAILAGLGSGWDLGMIVVAVGTATVVGGAILLWDEAMRRRERDHD